MSEQDEIARQELLDQQKFLQLERLFIEKFLDLAEHLGCKPEDLNVDLVAWYEALRSAEALIEQTGHGAMRELTDAALGKMWGAVLDQIRQALPHDTVDRADIGHKE